MSEFRLSAIDPAVRSSLVTRERTDSVIGTSTLSEANRWGCFLVTSFRTNLLPILDTFSLESSMTT